MFERIKLVKFSLVIISFLLFANLYAQVDPKAEKQRFETLDKKSELSQKELREMLNISDRAQNYDLNATISYLERTRKHMEKQEEYFYLTEYAEKIGLAYLMTGDPQKGKDIVDKLVEQYKDKFNDDELIKVQVLTVRFLEHMDMREECLALINKLLPQTDNTLYRAALYTFRGGINFDKSNYDAAAKDYYNSLKLYKKINNDANVIIAYNRLGLLNHTIENYPEALKYYKLGLNMALKANSERDLGPIYLNMGNLYQRIDSLDKALYYYDKNLELIKKTNNVGDIARNYLNRGNVYLKRKEYSKAFESFDKSLQICNENGIDIGKVHNYVSIGEAYLQVNNYDKSISSLDSALYYAKLTEAKDMQLNIYSQYSDTYKKMGDYKKAYDYYHQFNELEHELMDEEKQRTISELEVKYETELKDQKITQINEKLATEKAQNQILILAAASLVLITGFIIFFLIYRNRTLKQLYDRNIEVMQNFQFKASETEEAGIPESANENEDNLKKVFGRILFALEKERIYTNPTLSLSDTADYVKSNDKYVSAAIAEHANMNYSNFINFYRINEAKRLIYEEGHFNLNEVMYACGFNSRTTFYNAFKKHTGMSPKQFKEIGNSTLSVA